MPNQPFTQFSEGYQIDIDKLYNKWIGLIDKYRSNSKVDGPFTSTSENGNNDKKKQGGPSPSYSFAEDSSYAFKETRCHAFYRILGLPVISDEAISDKDYQFFNPGYDWYKGEGKSTDWEQKKINIANGFIRRLSPSLNTLNLRENYLNEILKIFSVEDINSSVLALISKNVRLFSSCLDNNPDKDPLEINSEDNMYQISSLDINRKDMLEYLDGSKNPPNKIIKSPYLKDNFRYHFIRPILTDPRISFSVGESVQFNVPFFILSDDDNSDDRIQYPVCGLEQICRERFSKIQPASELSDYQKESIDYIKSLPNIKPNGSTSKEVQIEADKLIQTYTGSSKSLNVYFANFVGLARSLMQDLKTQVNIINNYQRVYHFLPNPSKSGPEFGSGLKKIVFNDPDNTDEDKQIVKLTAKSTLEQIKIGQENFLGSARHIIQTKIDQQPFTSITGYQQGPPPEENTTQFFLSRAVDARRSNFESVDKALRRIEYITGEFSGLGLCDMWVIISALYLVDANVLISLLDDIAFARMVVKGEYFNITLPENIKERMPITDALKELTKKMKELYSICDDIYFKLPQS